MSFPVPFLDPLNKRRKSTESETVYESDSSHAKTNSNQNWNCEHPPVLVQFDGFVRVLKLFRLWLRLAPSTASRRQRGTGVGLDHSGPEGWKQTGSFTFFPYSLTWNIWDSSHNWWLSIFLPVKLFVSVMSLLERRGKRKPATPPPSGDSLRVIGHHFLPVWWHFIRIKAWVASSNAFLNDGGRSLSVDDHSLRVRYVFGRKMTFKKNKRLTCFVLKFKVFSFFLF